MKSVILLFLFFIISITSFSQGDSSYRSLNVLPFYPGGEPKLIEDISSGIYVYKGSTSCDLIKVEVLVKFNISEKGRVENVAITKTSGCEKADKRVMNAFYGLKRFKPAIQDGKPVSFTMLIPIVVDIPQ